MIKRTPHNITLRGPLFEVLRDYIIPKTRHRSPSDFLDAMMAKRIKADAAELRKQAKHVTAKEREAILAVLEEVEA